MFILPTYVNASKHVDRISQEYLQKFGVSNFGDPSKVFADGSCLLNAVSVFLRGAEQLSTELTCIEMVSRKDVYTSLPSAKRLIWVASNYVASSNDCAKRHGWSSIWTILAFAEVIGMPIESVYLPLNGVKDMYFKTLNMLAVPRNCRDENGIVTVLWTRNIRHNPRQMWMPNHFVPLIKPTSSQTITTLTTENTVPQIHNMTEFPPLGFDQKPPTQCRPAKADSTDDFHPDSTYLPPLSSTPISSPASKFPAVDINEDLASRNSTLNDTLMVHSDIENFEAKNPSTTGNQLKKGNLSAIEVFRAVINTENLIHEHIPPGTKGNIYLLLDNTKNVLRQQTGKSSVLQMTVVPGIHTVVEP